MFSLLLAVTIVAREPGYTTSLANHVQRWLRAEGVASEVVTPAEMQKKLLFEKVAFLVGFDKLTPAERDTLSVYSARGGKLVVFNSSSAELGSLMGVKPGAYKAAAYPGQWGRMDFAAQRPAGAPAAVEQTSGGITRAVPIEGKGRVMATWTDRNGRPTGEAAWISSPGGYWMTHVLLPDGDEALKGRLCASLVGAADPALWNPVKAAARADAEFKALRAFAAKQTPRPGEIHAVWDHTGCGLYPGNWQKTMKVLRESHVTDLFVNVGGIGFAHYASGVLPRSKTFREQGDQLAQCLLAARGTGIRVHAWILCFSATRGSPDTLTDYEKRGWRLKSKDGKLTEYVNPANPLVRARVLEAIDELQRYQIAGVHLDFVRWGETVAKPAGAVEQITTFVAEARRHVRRPKWLTTAVYGKYPKCVGTVAQDWKPWLDANFVDYIVPMDYTEDTRLFQELLATQAAQRGHAKRTIVGVGVTANESRLDAKQVINQINLSRKYGFAGNALFDLDTTLEKQILPFLRLGLW